MQSRRARPETRPLLCASMQRVGFLPVNTPAHENLVFSAADGEDDGRCSEQEAADPDEEAQTSAGH